MSGSGAKDKGVSRETRAYLLLVLCAAIWGFAFVAQRLGAEYTGAFTFNATRSALGAVALLPLVWFLDRRARRSPDEARQAWRAVARPGLLIGLLFFGGSVLQQLGVERTTAGNAAFVTGLYIVAVPIAGRLYGHRTGAATWVGLALAVPGLALLTWTDAGIGLGDLLCLVGALFWTFHILSVGRESRLVDPLRLAVAQFAVNATVSGAVALAAEPAPFSGLVEAAGAIAFAGLISTGVGFTLQIVSQRDARESVAAMIMSLEAMFGAIGGALFLGERMTGQALAGAGLMMAGILVAQVPSRALRQREAHGDAPRGVPVPEPPSVALRDD